MEAQIIALIAAYLIVHPFGVSIESICVYLRQTMKTLDLQVATLEQILTTYTNLFKMECQPADAEDDETKVQWKFCGFTEAANHVSKEENETANEKNEDKKKETV